MTWSTCDVSEQVPCRCIVRENFLTEVSIFLSASMVKMVLAEVFNPHFAVPVVGVLLCALLVYAFGFKSPVQPPSFDFEQDEKKKKPQRKKVGFSWFLTRCRCQKCLFDF